MSWRQWKEKGKGKGPAVEDSWTVSLSMSSQKGWFMAKARYSEKVSLILERREVWTSLWLTASSFFFFSSMLHTEMLEVDSTKMLRHGSFRSESTQCFRYAPDCWNPNTIFFFVAGSKVFLGTGRNNCVAIAIAIAFVSLLDEHCYASCHWKSVSTRTIQRSRYILEFPQTHAKLLVHFFVRIHGYAATPPKG